MVTRSVFIIGMVIVCVLAYQTSVVSAEAVEVSFVGVPAARDGEASTARFTVNNPSDVAGV